MCHSGQRALEHGQAKSRTVWWETEWRRAEVKEEEKPHLPSFVFRNRLLLPFTILCWHTGLAKSPAADSFKSIKWDTHALEMNSVFWKPYLCFAERFQQAFLQTDSGVHGSNTLMYMESNKDIRESSPSPIFPHHPPHSVVFSEHTPGLAKKVHWHNSAFLNIYSTETYYLILSSPCFRDLHLYLWLCAKSVMAATAFLGQQITHTTFSSGLLDQDFSYNPLEMQTQHPNLVPCFDHVKKLENAATTIIFPYFEQGVSAGKPQPRTNQNLT